MNVFDTEELRRALEAADADPALGPALDLARVHALGYSLGAATVLAAAAAGIDLNAVAAHCTAHGNEDAAFCEPPPLLWRLVQRLRKPVSIEDMPNQFFVEPFVNGRVAVVAPMGQGLRFVPEHFVAVRTTVIAIEGDDIVPPPFHAEPLASALPPERLAGFVSVVGRHYAFIAPFPEWLTSKEDVPVAKDPEGFDRPGFIEHKAETGTMDSPSVFSARDLRHRSGELFRDAEEGRLAIITKHGYPSILAVPFSERLLELGVHRTLALHLFEEHKLTLTRAAKLAGVTPEEFIDMMGEVDVPAVDYPPGDLDEELSTAS